MNHVAVTSRSFSKHPLLREELTKRYPKVTFNDSGKTLQGLELIDFLKGHDMAIVGLERLNAEALNHLPQLKVVSRFGVGLDTLDLDAMKRQGVKLAYTAGANKRAVAELVIAFAIMMLRQLPLSNRELQRGVWQQRKGRQLSNRKVGIIGLGEVGKDLAQLLKAFNCTVTAFDVVDHGEFCAANNIEQSALEPLLKTCDIISLHLPLNSQTSLLLDRERLQLIKAEAILINTARGGLIDEASLKERLQHQQLAGAALDVFASEPPQDIELLALPNFFATPHIGGSTEEAILAMGKAAINGLETAIIL
jgi:phosphoglycerate dehydrogenase-like enzyme